MQDEIIMILYLQFIGAIMTRLKDILHKLIDYISTYGEKRANIYLYKKK